MGIFGGTGKVPRRARHRRRVAVALGALALVALWWFLVRESAPAILNVDITDTRTPGSPLTHLRIPRAYLDRSMLPDAREQPLVELIAYLPGLITEEEAKRAGYPTARAVVDGIKLMTDDELPITLYNSVPDGVSKSFHGMIGERDVRFDGIRDGTYEVYTITKRNFAGNYLPDPSQGEYLKPLGRDDLFVECPSLNMPPEYTRCNFYIQFSDRLEILFILGRNRLAEWPSVEAKVKELVASFVVE